MARRGDPTPYMDGLRFRLPEGDTADPDQRVLSDDELQRAQDEGSARTSHRRHPLWSDRESMDLSS